MKLIGSFLDNAGYVRQPLNFVPGLPNFGDLLYPAGGGWVPFDIELQRMSVSWDDYERNAAIATLQHRVGGTAYGAAITLKGNEQRGVVYDSPISIPGVLPSNVDTSSWTLLDSYPLNAGQGSYSITYRPVDDVHRGKQIMGFGGAGGLFVDALSATANVVQKYDGSAPFFTSVGVENCYAALIDRGTVGFNDYAYNGSVSLFFKMYAETTAQMTALRDTTPIVDAGTSPADIRWLMPGTFDDFMLVCRTAPTTGDAVFAFRHNEQTLFTITAYVGGTRVFTPFGGTFPIQARRGDRFTWQCLLASEILDAQLIWSFKRVEGSSLVDLSGYNEGGYNEGGYGTS